MQHSAHLNTGFDFMLRYDEVQTEKKQAMLPFPTPSRHHLFISPFFFRVPIFAVPPCFCCPASRRTYRCHCQLFGPPVTLWTRAKTSSRKKTEKKKNRLSLNLLWIFTVSGGSFLMTWVTLTSRARGQNLHLCTKNMKMERTDWHEDIQRMIFHVRASL